MARGTCPSPRLSLDRPHGGLQWTGRAHSEQALGSLRRRPKEVTGSFHLVHDDGRSERLAVKPHTVEIPPDATLCITTPGAGGYGPPEGRSKRRLALDVASGKLSPGRLEEQYGYDISELPEVMDSHRYCPRRSGRLAFRPARPCGGWSGTMVTRGIKQLIAEANAAVYTVSVPDAMVMHGDSDVVFVDVRETVELRQGGLRRGSGARAARISRVHGGSGKPSAQTGARERCPAAALLRLGRTLGAGRQGFGGYGVRERRSHRGRIRCLAGGPRTSRVLMGPAPRGGEGTFGSGSQKMGLEARPAPLWCAMKPQGAGYEFAGPGGYRVVCS